MDKQETPTEDRVRQNLFRLRDLESVLGVCGKTIGRLVKTGRFPAPLLVGHSRRWRPEDVDGYLAHQAQATGLPGE
jgi:predicted DNA-binding transcriptional regulator AlpA